MRKKCPERGVTFLGELRARGVIPSLGVAAVFALVVSAIVMLREDSVPFKPGQYVPSDILSRVDFQFVDKEKLAEKRNQKRESTPRVYVAAKGDSWGALQSALLELPDRIGTLEVSQLPGNLRTLLRVDEGNEGAVNQLRLYQAPERKAIYQRDVERFITALRPLVLLPQAQREKEVAKTAWAARVTIVVDGKDVRVEDTFAVGEKVDRELYARLQAAARDAFSPALYPKLTDFTIQSIRPSHELDEVATAQATSKAADSVPDSVAHVLYPKNLTLVPGDRVLDEKGWQLLKAEKDAFVKGLGHKAWKTRLGLVGSVLLLTGVLCVYVYRYQGKIVRNRMRATAIALLLGSMLLLTQLAGIGTGSLHIFGLAPTLLAAMILAIAYDQRFAVGVASIHGILVTIALDQSIGFYLIQFVGVVTTCLMVNEIRTRSKLIEVGGAAALAMMAATAAAGAVTMDPLKFVTINCLYAGAAGLAVGFVALGILPFIEKAFKITTSMTLLELADASQPLLRRLQVEAPGTYSHSLQVATLAEAAAEAIGANSLLCRVASYYHDVGKINKADYFIENQSDGRNRHINLSPSVSLLIIIGHVKDGIELAREYNLPMSVIPFIQQHHGTTLVEYFYHQALKREDAAGNDGPQVPETQYRYPGPKPKSREIAILMIADAVESAVRAMPEPNASRIETLVHDLAMKRLHDGQFDECDLTFRELELVERALTKTLLGIYHTRVQYPSTAAITGGPAAAAKPAVGAARTA
ncbi:MAG: HD family phosphohydrolase [Phycisphaerae bacterium]|nr:HDIG domain-containing protein [Tepidisphaeraceae bacterium]